MNCKDCVRIVTPLSESPSTAGSVRVTMTGRGEGRRHGVRPRPSPAALSTPATGRGYGPVPGGSPEISRSAVARPAGSRALQRGCRIRRRPAVPRVHGLPAEPAALGGGPGARRLLGTPPAAPRPRDGLAGDERHHLAAVVRRGGPRVRRAAIAVLVGVRGRTVHGRRAGVAA